MKKILYTFVAIAAITSVSSCKKCGYCKDPIYGNGSAVCQESSVIPGITSSYDSEKAQCSADGGTWVITK